MTLLAILVVSQFLWKKKNVNLKLELVKNYNIKKKKKQKTSSHAQSACDEASNF